MTFSLLSLTWHLLFTKFSNKNYTMNCVNYAIKAFLAYVLSAILGFSAISYYYKKTLKQRFILSKGCQHFNEFCCHRNSIKGGLSGRMTQQFLNVLQLFSLWKRKLSNFRFCSIFIINKKEPESCQFATYRRNALFELLTSQKGKIDFPVFKVIMS